MDREELKKEAYSTLAVVERAIPSVKDKKKEEKKRKLPKIKLFYNER